MSAYVVRYVITYDVYKRLIEESCLMTSSTIQTGRIRRPRNSLTVESILDAAEKVAAEGFDGLTIRAVATSLEASPMALYRYFATKEDLVDALLNTVLGRFTVPSETEDWVADLEAFARNHLTMLTDHAWAIAPLTSHPQPGVNALPIGESALGILYRGGITGDNAVATFSAIVALNYGWASFVSGRTRAEDMALVQPSPTPATRSRFPRTAVVAEALGRYGSHVHYDFALTLLLAGIVATRATESPSSL